MDDGKIRDEAKEAEAEKWKKDHMPMLRKYSPEPDFPLPSSLNQEDVLKMKTPELKKEMKWAAEKLDPKFSADLAKLTIEEGLKIPK